MQRHQPHEASRHHQKGRHQFIARQRDETAAHGDPAADIPLVSVALGARLDTIQAAVLLPKLARLDAELAARQAVAERYDSLLGDAGVTTTPFVESFNQSAWAQYTIRTPDREAVQESLKQAGVPTAVHYPIPLNRQPAVADPDASLPTGDQVASEVMSLPMGPYLTEEDQNQVVTAVRTALKG